MDLQLVKDAETQIPSQAGLGTWPGSQDALSLRGGSPLTGVISAQGSKKEAPKLLIAALLTSEACRIEGLPAIEEIETTVGLLNALGASVTQTGPGVARVSAPELRALSSGEAVHYSRRSRIPLLLCGPLLARTGEARIPGLGGCPIGARSIDFHVSLLERMGACVDTRGSCLILKARGLTGTRLRFPAASVGATEQALLAGALAKGITEVSPIALDPEILSLITVLRSMGAEISITADRTLQVRGVDCLSGFTRKVSVDRFEVGSWACAAVGTDGRIQVQGARTKGLTLLLRKLEEIGGGYEVANESLTFFRAVDEMRPTIIAAAPFPGLETDFLPALVPLLGHAYGSSLVHDGIFEGRLRFMRELQRLGYQTWPSTRCLGALRCRFQGSFHSACVEGPNNLRGAHLVVCDLRGGFASLLAALMATGRSTLTNVGLLNRGYESVIRKFASLGADIEGHLLSAPNG